MLRALSLPLASARLARCLCTQSSAADAVIAAVQRRFGAGPSSAPPPPSAAQILRAVREVDDTKNGYRAWALYVALRQGSVALPAEQLAKLAGAMLHVDHDVFSEDAAHRALTVLENSRADGIRPPAALLVHAARACALVGLAERAEALLHEHTELRGFLSINMVGALIEAHGKASRLDRAIKVYRDLEQTTGRRPPGIPPAVGLLRASEQAGDLDHGFCFLYELLQECSVAPRPTLLLPLLRGCARADDLEKAYELLDLAKTHNLHIENVTIREFALAGGRFLPPAKRLYEDAKANGITISKASISKLISACAMAGDENGAFDLILEAGGGLDGAFDLMHGLARQQRQLDAIEFDVRRSSPSRPPRRDGTPDDI
ncbi:hypothetical protein AB1Y20_019476 [Prymnesium parvum]|uniref:Pentacotripeptide-repeat region of PRORP domain-containing protein n=1 Tax=Prymnesium parvum TaxID=97485 RepID=A0AB34JR99_PRYPA